MSLPNKNRNFQTKSRKSLPNSSNTITSSDEIGFTAIISQTLHDTFGETGRAIKTVMKYTGASERTVKNWFQGKNGPNGENLIRLIQHSDEVLEVTLLMAERDDVIAGKLLVDARDKLIEMIKIIDNLSNKQTDSNNGKDHNQ